MKIERSLAFDFDNGSLPRLLQEEVVQPELKNVDIRESSDKTAIIRVSSLIPMAEEASDNYDQVISAVLEDYNMNSAVIVADQTMYMINPTYQHAVHAIREAGTFPIHMQSAGYDEDLYAYLMECIDHDIENGTNTFISILDENTFTDKASIATNNVDQAASGFFDRVKNAVKNKMDEGIKAGIEKGLEFTNDTLNNDPEMAKNITQGFEAAGRASGKKAVEGFTGAAKNSIEPYAKGAMLGMGAAAILGAMAVPFYQLTNQETIKSVSPPAAVKVINTLNKIKEKLTGKEQNPMIPPQQKGVISAIIAKIKAAIYALGRKVGIVK